ncbi:hypothetical protein ACQ86N_06200 [Puia sp. P3]|uniref:hypothetical protein n=1 Tax=Puia sp. P3 TaxID=3423952 RepID=UPI003D67EB1D
MIIIAYQMHYSMTADMGFQKDSIVTLSLPTGDLTKMRSLRDRTGQPSRRRKNVAQLSASRLPAQ